MPTFDLNPEFVDDNAALAKDRLTEAMSLLRSIADAAAHAVSQDINILTTENDEDVLQTIGEIRGQFDLLWDLLQ